MYPVKLGFGEALKRINALIKNGYSAEALVTSVFTLEKLMHRSLRVAILSRGFTSKHADHLLGRKGFGELKDLWNVFDRTHRTLPALVGNADWQHVHRAVEMRNKLVHGQQVYNFDECKTYAKRTKEALQKFHRAICDDYGTDPWTKLSGRSKAKLNWHTVNSSPTIEPHPARSKKMRN